MDQPVALGREFRRWRNTAQLFCITRCIFKRRSAVRRAAGRVTELVEARQRLVGGILRQFGLVVAGDKLLGAAQRRCTAEHDEIDQRVRAEAIGAVH